MLLPDLRNEKELNASLSKAKVVRETAKQIMKDFAMFGLKITFSGYPEYAYEELHRQIVKQIDCLMENDYNKLISVLYQVDISARDIEKTEREMLDYNHVEVIAHEIIVRDLKKVLLRNYFKKHG